MRRFQPFAAAPDKAYGGDDKAALSALLEDDLVDAVAVFRVAEEAAQAAERAQEPVHATAPAFRLVRAA